MNNKNVVIRWKVTDPQQRSVVLKQNTYEKHVDEDHDTKDAEYRKKMEELVKKTLIDPQFIIQDKSGNGNLNYLGLAIVSEDNEKFAIKLVKVILDVAPSPNEVITWIIQRRISEGKMNKEEIIYERDSGK